MLNKRIHHSIILTTFLLTAGAIGPVAGENPVPPTGTAPAHSNSFDFSDVEGIAKTLSTQKYTADTGGLPEYLRLLDYDQYRDIRFKREKSLWLEEKLPFQLQFFHRGFLFKDRVKLNLVEGGIARPIDFSRDYFDYGKNQFPEQMPSDMGLAGFRILYPLLKNPQFDEIAVFQGASYFRGIGLEQVYGLSARGLALDTGMSKAEEFPVFKEFWLEKPAPESTFLTVYALLDSPSVTGAYRFIIRPEVDLVMDVKAHLYLRQGVERFGVAPLTSMFFHGENSDRFFDDFRPEVHDSDGLLIGMRNGEWVWRPLNNPRRLRTSVFQGDDIVGFGLIQRDRNFENYQDLEAMYHQRPSVWVETLGTWGKGSVYLIEIPIDAEKYDNIVAFWSPDKATFAGQELTFDYRLHFHLNNSLQPAIGKTLATRIGGSGTDVLISSKRKFVVDFEGETLRSLSSEALVEAVLNASSGQISNTVVHKNSMTGSWRLIFDFEPEPDKDPVDLRAHLKANNQVLTETWIHQWNKP